ncbi:trypsin-like peptidase domain-containing protein [Streptomyces sp. HUAS MG47]|uniref:nSTAND1 domain-containing NTPase n=1 Tax=Streptomyces solicamelliae TaxID=3231716 RepID=UPI003877B528
MTDAGHNGGTEVTVTGVRGQDTEEAELALVSAVLRIKGPDGSIGGAGFVISPDLVLTCAHVVSDALDRPREDTVEVGTEVTVDVPLAGHADGVHGGDHTAEVQRWIPIRPDHTGDIAVLRLRAPIPGARPLPVVEPRRGVWDHDARAVGFTDDSPDGIWQSGRFRGPTRQGWIQLSRADGEAVYVKGGFSGSPVWDNELGAAVGLMVAAQPVREAQQAFVLRMRTLLKEVPELAPFVSPASPFRGLSTFEENDRDVFFGRNDDIERVINALRGEQPTITVYGPSGCGKSSLALAGVVPRMRQDGYRILRVNATRSASLRVALATELFEIARLEQDGPPREQDADQVDRWLRELGLADTFHRITGRPAARLLVVLDQAEALLNRPEAEIAETVELLFPERRPAGSRILVTLRADLMGAALSHTHLGPALKRGMTLPLTPMTRDQLHEVITEPLKHIPAVEYDPGLDRRILDDAGDEPGILPLLGFVLAQLWERRSAGRLRAATYEEIGGVSGALRHHAEKAWRECVTPEGEAEARQLLTGLVRLLPGGEAPLRRALTREEAGEGRWRLAQALAERRLLVLHGGDDRSESAELAHEALITVWPALAELVRADADFLAARADLQHEVERWRKAHSPADLLPGSRRLAAFEERLREREADLTEEQRQFLALARQRRRARHVQVSAGWVAVVLALVLIAGLVTFLVRESQVSAERAAEGRSRALARLSDQLTRQDRGKAALVAMAAYEISPTEEARGAMLRRYDQLKRSTWMLSGTEGPISDVASSVDGRVVLATTEQGRATLFVRTAEGRVLQEHLRLAELAFRPLVSRDGRRIAYMTTEGNLYWREVHAQTAGARSMVGPASSVHDGAIERKGRSHQLRNDSPYLADFSPDGRRLVTMADDERLQVWNLETKQPRQVPGRATDARQVRFGPEGNTLLVERRALATDVSTVTAVDIRTGRSRELADRVSLLFDTARALSGDGSVITVCQVLGDDEDAVRYRSLRVADGRELNRYDDENTGICGDVAADATGKRFVVQASSGGWTLVDNRRGAKTTSVTGPRQAGPLGLRQAGTLERLLGEPSRPVVFAWDPEAVTGASLTEDNPGDSSLITNHPVLLDGDLVVARLGRVLDSSTLRESRLAVVDPDGKVVSEARLPPRDVPRSSSVSLQGQVLAVNGRGDLTANVVGRDKVLIHELPSLRKLAEVTTVPPPVDRNGTPEPLRLRFTGEGDELVTVSGSRIEHWDARNGHRLSRTLDARELGLTRNTPPLYSSDEQPGESGFRVSAYPRPGHVQIMVVGEPVSHIVDLRSGKEDKGLRLRLGPDVSEIVRSGSYAAVRTRGSVLELWSIRPGEPPERTVGPLGPLNSRGEWGAGFTRNGSEFFLANGNTVRFQSVSDAGRFESYDFDTDQTFFAASKDGRTLLRDVDGATDLIRLDPALWKRHLCTAVGRELTPDDRSGLPSGIPDRICPDRQSTS